jgi:hypothetical protein
MWLSYMVFRSGSVPDLDGPDSLAGGTSTGGTTREGINELGGMVVLGVSGPWGQPRGPTVFLAVQWVSDHWNRSETPTWEGLAAK